MLVKKLAVIGLAVAMTVGGTVSVFAKPSGMTMGTGDVRQEGQMQAPPEMQGQEGSQQFMEERMSDLDGEGSRQTPPEFPDRQQFMEKRMSDLDGEGSQQTPPELPDGQLQTA